jgi:hypothetical protein
MTFSFRPDKCIGFYERSNDYLTRQAGFFYLCKKNSIPYILMRKFLLPLILFSIISAETWSQENQQMSGAQYCSRKKQSQSVIPDKPFIAEGTPTHAFNVLNYKLELDLYSCYFSPYPHAFPGKEVITIKADSAINSIVLDAVNYSLIQ